MSSLSHKYVPEKLNPGKTPDTAVFFEKKLLPLVQNSKSFQGFVAGILNVSTEEPLLWRWLFLLPALSVGSGCKQSSIMEERCRLPLTLPGVCVSWLFLVNSSGDARCRAFPCLFHQALFQEQTRLQQGTSVSYHVRVDEPATTMADADWLPATIAKPGMCKRSWLPCLVWLLLRNPEHLNEQDQQLLSFICRERTVHLAYTFAQRFVAMVHYRQAEYLDAWLEAGLSSGIPDMLALAHLCE